MGNDADDPILCIIGRDGVFNKRAIWFMDVAPLAGSAPLNPRHRCGSPRAIPMLNAYQCIVNIITINDGTQTSTVDAKGVFSEDIPCGGLSGDVIRDQHSICVVMIGPDDLEIRAAIAWGRRATGSTGSTNARGQGAGQQNSRYQGD